MKRFHVRNAILDALKEKGLYIETKDNPMQIPVCSKSGDIIEAILKPQWWVDMKDVAKEAVKVRAKTILMPSHGNLLIVHLHYGFAANGSWRAQGPSISRRKGMETMDEQYAGLVYLQTTLVGSQMSSIPHQL